MSASSNLRPSKIYPNWDFWFENKPFGNPALLVAGLSLSGANPTTSEFTNK
jgi:hypothetical protein